MKRGYQLMYHKMVPQEHIEYIKTFLDKQDMIMIKGYGCRRLSGAFYRRNILGFVIDNEENLPKNIYTFKRLSTKRRIFGVVPITVLEGNIDLNQCMCAMHRGGQRVKFNGGFKEEDFILYSKRGDIKG